MTNIQRNNYSNWPEPFALICNVVRMVQCQQNKTLNPVNLSRNHLQFEILKSKPDAELKKKKNYFK